jgi:hypothetical protein
MMHKLKSLTSQLIILLLVLNSSLVAVAQARRPTAVMGKASGGSGGGGSKYPNIILRGHQHLYTGLKNKSFADTQTGLGVSLHKLLKYEYFVPYFGIGFDTHAARQTFLDDATDVMTNYTFQSGSAELGAYVFPAGRQVKGMSVYLSGSGIFNYNFLALDKTKVFTKISNTDQNYGSGYKGAIGFEWIISKTPGARWSLYGEMGFKKVQTVLAKQNFSLDSIMYTIGLGW